MDKLTCILVVSSLIVGSLIVGTESHGHGVPPSACLSMMPSHSAVAQPTQSSPYRVTAVYEETPDSNFVNVTIQGDYLRGFILQARSQSMPNITLINGVFISSGSGHRGIKTMECDGHDSVRYYHLVSVLKRITGFFLGSSQHVNKLLF